MKKKDLKAKKEAVIGWNEEAHLPDFDIWDIPVKIDTGAKTSSLHAEDIEKLPKNRVRFRVIFDNRKPEKNKIVTAKIHRRGLVRTNHEHNHYRIFIKTHVSLGPINKTIEVNLADRSDFNFRMILGRSAIPKGVLINASRSKVVSSRKSKGAK